MIKGLERITGKSKPEKLAKLEIGPSVSAYTIGDLEKMFKEIKPDTQASRGWTTTGETLWKLI